MTTQPPVATARLTPASDTSGVKVLFDMFHIDEIPGAMDNMGWTISANLMRHWFSIEPAWEMPERWRGGKYPNDAPIDYTKLPASQVNDSIVTMKWAMQYPKVRQAMAALKGKWNDTNGLKELHNKLTSSGWQRGQTFRLGKTSLSAPQLDYASEINFVKFGSMWDTLNEFFGAIWKGNLKVAVVGKAYRKLFGATGGKDFFHVDALGFYIRDTYDFNYEWIEDEFMGLGVWSKQRLLSKFEMAEFKELTYMAYATPALFIARFAAFPGFVQVTNRDFRRWQAKHNSGGDFFVFSDVLWEDYKGPDLEIPRT